MHVVLGPDGKWRVISDGQTMSVWDDKPDAITAAASLAPSADGVPFTMPLILPEGVWSSDGRMFEHGTVQARPTPLSVMMQIVTDEGHDGAFLFGRLDSVVRDSQGNWSGTGMTYNSAEASEGVRMVAGGFITGVSVDAAASIFEDQSEFMETESGFQMVNRTVFKDGQIAGVTVCATPAFSGASIVMDGALASAEPAPLGLAASIHRASAKTLVASAELSVVEEPPSDWFGDPAFTEETTVALPGYPGKRGCPLTILPSGQVFGHIAIWGVPHTGFGGQKIYAPHSSTDYAYFQTGAVLCADGKTLATGPLTCASGHAELEDDAMAARAHYDNTAAAVADVAVGEDGYGVWCAGYIRPGATREQVAALRASGISGDWRPIGTGLELVAALAVNSPGFPVARSRVASGHVMALVAAGGVNVLLRASREPWRAELDEMRAELAEVRAALRPTVKATALARAKAAISS